MELLLLLSALLSGISGVLSGEGRVDQPRVEQAAAAIATLSDAGAEQSAATLSRPARIHAPHTVRAPRFALSKAPVRDVLSMTGIRLE